MNNKSIFSNKGDKNFIGHGTLFQGDVQTTFFDLHICLVNTLLVRIIQPIALWILTSVFVVVFSFMCSLCPEKNAILVQCYGFVS